MKRSNIFLRTLFLMALSLFTHNIFAAEKVLCVVTSDMDKEIGQLTYEMDEEARVIKHLYKERYLNGKLIEKVEMFAKDLLGDGIIMHKKDKYVTVRLYSHNFDESSGGIIFIDTLYSGISGQRKEYPVEVRMDGGSDMVMTYSNKVFNRMHFIAKKSPIFGPIGIEKVNFLVK